MSPPPRRVLLLLLPSNWLLRFRNVSAQRSDILVSGAIPRTGVGVACRRGIRGLQQPQRHGSGHGRAARGDVELREDVLDVRLDRFRRDLEGARNALVGIALADLGEDIAFPGRDRVAVDTGLPGTVD